MVHTKRALRASAVAVLAAAASSLTFGGGTAQAAACTFSPVTPPAAQWDIVPPSCFEGGDGDLAIQNAKGTNRTDWSSISATTAPDASGPADLAFGSGSHGKEFDPAAWTLVEGAVTPAKIDLLADATKVDPVSGDLFLYGAFLRSGSTGDANLAFELNADGTLWDNDGNAATPPVPTRSAGDVLLTFDGGSHATVGICRWVGPREGTGTGGAANAGWYTVSAVPVRVGGNQDCTPLSSLASPLALGGMNATGPLDNIDHGGPGIADDVRYLAAFPDEIPTNTFGEITVNLTRALTTLGTPDPCFDFGSIWLHSRNSSSASADMGDYFSPVPLVGAKTCAIALDKQVKVGGGAYEQGLTATPAWASTGDTLTYKFDVTNAGQEPITGAAVTDPKCDPGTLSAFDKHGDTSTGTLDTTDTWTATCTRAYTAGDPNTLVNTATAVGAVGTKALSATDTATVRRLARLTLVKDQVGGSDATAFTFSVPTALEAGGTKSLSEADGAKLYAGLQPGSYAVTEASKAGWALTDLRCVTSGTQTPDVDTTVSVPSRTATVDLASGDDVTCTFENTKDASLTIVKSVTNDNGGTKAAADFQIGYTSASGDGSVTGSTAGVTTTVGPGAYSVTETAPTGYSPSYSGDCGGTIAVGQDAVCTVTNDDVAPRVKVVKEVVNANGSTGAPSDFTMHVTGTDVSSSSFAGDAEGVTVTLDAGPYSVSETGDLTSYAAAASADCTGTVAIGESRTCTLTNTRKTGTLELVKSLSPASDAGRFALLVDGVARTAAAGVGDGGTTGSLSVTTGTRTIAEEAVAPAHLANYLRRTDCYQGPELVASSADGGPLVLPVAADASYRCVVTNTRLSPPAGAVLGVTITAPERGRSALAGPNGCVAPRTAKAYVTGRQIAQVRFLLDGRTLATVRRADARGRWLVTVTTKQLGMGKHRLRAVVRYRTVSRTRARTLSLSFTRCAAARLPATVG